MKKVASLSFLTLVMSMSARAMIISKTARRAITETSYHHSDNSFNQKTSTRTYTSETQQKKSSDSINREALKKTRDVINWEVVKEKCEPLAKVINTEKYPGLKKPFIATLAAAHIGLATYSTYKFGIDISNDAFGPMMWDGVKVATRVAIAHKLAQEKAGVGTAALSIFSLVSELCTTLDIANHSGRKYPNTYWLKEKYGFTSFVSAGLVHAGLASFDAITLKIAATSEHTKKALRCSQCSCFLNK